MSRFGSAVRHYLLDRILNGRRNRRSYGRADQPLYAPRPRPRPRRRFGFWGPVPYYSTRPRRGREVSVGGCGCCLPIPLLVVLGTVGVLRALWKRLH
ncbi:MAG: hypothetical protein ACRDRK_12345 [Pseudonocardia sp.]